jgi:hypothetical protein
MTIRYEPGPGSWAAKIFAVLRKLGPDVHPTSAELAALIGGDSNDISRMMRHALSVRAVIRTKCGHEGSRIVTRWEMADYSPPVRTAEELITSPSTAKVFRGEGAYARNVQDRADRQAQAKRDSAARARQRKRELLNPTEPIIPDGLEVQHCPGMTHIPRYQVGPGESFEGLGLMAEWRARRAA